MTRYIFLLVIVCGSALFISGESSCVSEVEEGTSKTYSNSIWLPWSSGPIRWTVTVSGRSQTVARCYSALNCTSYFPSEFNASFKEDPLMGASSGVAVLTIKSLNRTMTKVECKDSLFSDGACDLVVFTKPSSLSCYSPEVKDDFIKVYCTSPNEVFPNPVCRFNYTPPDLQFEYNITYDKSYRTCTLLGRPTSLTNQTELKFYAEMYPNVTLGTNYKVGLDDWTPPITVEMVKFTANNERTSLVVEDGSYVHFVCVLNSEDPLYTLQFFMSDFLLETGGEGENSVTAQRYVDSTVSGTEYFCRARNTFRDIWILPDSLKVYVKGPLQLVSSLQNNTSFYIGDGEDVSLKFSIWGYPGPQSYILRYQLPYFDSEWITDYQFHKSYVGYLNEIPPRFTVIVEHQHPHVHLDAVYSLEISNGVGPKPLRIHFTFRTNGLETTTRPSLPKYRPSSSSSSTNESWVLGVILGLVGSCAVVVGVICIITRRRRNRSSQAQGQQRGTGQASLVINPRINNSGQTGSNGGPSAPAMSSSANIYHIYTSGGNARVEPPAYDQLSIGPDLRHIGSTESTRDTQQVDAPPSYDTVCKPEELPPPYPGL